MTEICNRAGRLFKSCKWQPIYNIEGLTKTASDSIIYDITYNYKGDMWPQLIEQFVEKRTYIGMVCLRCGKTELKDGNV
jgi:hypothetical protein